MGAHRLTPAMRDLLHRIRKANRPPLHALGAVEARRLYESAAEVLEPPRAPLPRVETMVLPVGPGIERPARLYAPQPREAGVLPVLLYLHGGGFTVGSLETHDSLCRQLALRSGVAVVALDYRLAPGIFVFVEHTQTTGGSGIYANATGNDVAVGIIDLTTSQFAGVFRGQLTY